VGGAKKKNIAQMERAQITQEKKAEPVKKGKTKTVVERRMRGISIPDLNNTKFLSDLSKMTVITPYSLASQYNVRMSVAKDLLEELERKKLVKFVGGNARLRIYQAAS